MGLSDQSATSMFFLAWPAVAVPCCDHGETVPTLLNDGVSFTDRLIVAHVRGCSFVDVGALWGTRNEKVSVATLAGAKSAAIIDITPPGHDAWDKCRDRCALLGVSGYAEHSHDLNDPLIAKKVGKFDFVFCSGVVYHTPSVFYTLQRLFDLSERYLMLGSMVVPDTIENEFGSINLAGGGMLFVPGLNDKTRSIMAAHFASNGLTIAHISPTASPPEPFMWGPDNPNYGPWWWLLPLQTLCSLVETVGFKIIETNTSWGGRSAEIFCEK